MNHHVVHLWARPPVAAQRRKTRGAAQHWMSCPLRKRLLLDHRLVLRARACAARSWSPSQAALPSSRPQISRATSRAENLINAWLTGAEIVDVIWSNTTCPDGSNSDANENTGAGARGEARARDAWLADE
jgi:hypothetical protein